MRARVNGSKSIRSEPDHSRAIVITTVRPLLLLLFELLARYDPINLIISATLRTSGSLSFQTTHRPQN
jgi:hypothetical protein